MLSLLATLIQSPAEAAARRRAPRKSLSSGDLFWHVEALDGTVVESQQGDVAVNPASVVKVATSLWALELLGPEHRFETRFYARGRIDQARRTLVGDLVVLGSGDPDFESENAFLTASALNALGVERVSGALIVNHRFWIGSENGSEGRNADADRRGTLMAGRLRQALNPRRWDRSVRAAWRQFCVRRALAPAAPPKVEVVGGVGIDGEGNPGELLLVHRSQPLGEILRRFNCYSNNDIERVGESLGPVESLAELTATRCGVSRDEVQLETASGLGVNRLTPRLIVRLLREFRRTAERVGSRIEALLPVVGCDPGTVSRFFPHLANGPNAASVVGKTGTLTFTDGGVAVLAGFVKTGQGELVFCVALTNAHGRLRRGRQIEEAWLSELLASHGGGQPYVCAPLLSSPDAGANVILVADNGQQSAGTVASAGSSAP